MPDQLRLPLQEFALPEGTELPPRSRQVFCNRNLRLDQIEWIGFDMDYTLAIYKQDQIDKLSIEATAKKLVERGYTEALLTMPYRTDFPIRGLIIDKQLGNILKMDRFRYVKKAYHGMRELTREERRALYSKKQLRPGTERYHWVDTLYALSEVSIYAAAVDELERAGNDVDYTRLFTDVRTCIDLAHQDGSILDKILQDLPRYVTRDPELATTFHRLRSAGKRLFLLTNSNPNYTDAMMNFLVGTARPDYPSWRHYFEVVIAAARKPSYFVHTEPHMELLPDGSKQPAMAFERGKTYLGGNLEDLERMLGVSGDRILYVGDHIFGDVLRAKKQTAWRTAMIVQELGEELRVHDNCQRDLAKLDALADARSRIIEEHGYRQARLRELQKQIETSPNTVDGRPKSEALAELYASRSRHRRALERIRGHLVAVEAEITELEARIDKQFHPFWGSLFKVDTEASNFGLQVEQYACLYTDRVSNFSTYAPTHYFRSARHLMPHELATTPPTDDAPGST
jgi:5'-nucleotidase